MSRRLLAADLWQEVGSYADTYTCYSAALATWMAYQDADWAWMLDPGLWLTVAERPDGLFAFAHFPPGLHARLGLARTGSSDRSQALSGVLEELDRSGRVIVAGDGFRLPWHVAFERRHVPHWFVLGSGNGPSVIDPFSCRNELGVQRPHRAAISEDELAPLLEGLPGDDPVLAMRESLALGDEDPLPDGCLYQWFMASSVEGGRPPSGARGAEAVSLLASHLRQHGQDPLAYRQSDDVWSIARHRAFHCRHFERLAERTGDEALRAWVTQHARPLVRKWSHMAPLMMQATLALAAGREASGSVPATLEQLAELESEAAAAHPDGPLPFDAGRDT